MTTQHTPGPWTLHRVSHSGAHADYFQLVSEVKNREVIAIIHDRINLDTIKYEAKLADAHLLQAAPDLLEACIALVNGSDRDTAFHDALLVARKTIARAKGE